MAKNAEVSLLLKIKETGAKTLKTIADGLESIKFKAAATSAALVGFIGLALKNFGEQEQATKALENALRNQGFEVEKLSKHYAELASKIQNNSNFADEQITQGIAIAQSMAGQVHLTDELIRATVDFAAAQGVDLNTAFSLVGKSIGTSTNALARYGVEIDATASAEDKLVAITETLSAKFKGAANASRETLGGSIIALKMAFGDFLELVGAEFAPAISKAAEGLKDFAVFIQTNQIAKLTAVFVSVGAAVTGLVAGLGFFLPIIPKLIAGAKLLGAGLGLLLTPIGAIIAGIAGLTIAWQTNFLDVQQISFGIIGAVTSLFTDFISKASSLFSDFGSLLKSVFSFDIDGIRKSFNTLRENIASIANSTTEAFSEAYDERDKRILQSQESELLSTADNEEAKNILAKNAIESRIRAQALKRKQDEDEERANFSELLDIKESMNKRALEQRIKNREAAEKAELESIKTLSGNVEAFVKGGFQSVASKAMGMIADTYLPGVGGAVSSIFDLLSKNSEEFVETLNQLFKVEFLQNVLESIQLLIEMLPELLTNIINFISENMPAIIQNLVDALIANMPELFSAILKAMVKFFFDPKFHAELAAAIAKGFVSGFKDALGDISETLKKAISDALSFGGGGDGGDGGGFIGKIGGAVKSVGKTFGFEHGGLIPHLAHGGLVDNTLIAATPGEFVVNRASARANADLLSAINSSGGRSVSRDTSIIINVNGGMLGDRNSARQFAKAVDEQLFKLRQGNESRAFDSATVR